MHSLIEAQEQRHPALYAFAFAIASVALGSLVVLAIPVHAG